MAFLWACLVLGCFKDQAAEHEVRSHAAAYTRTAVELSAEFDKNGPAAESRYKGKILSVSGEVAKITQFITDLYVTMRGGFLAPGIRCYFSDRQKAAVFRLSKGQKVRLKGKFTEFAVGDVVMHGCVIETEE